VSEHPVPVGGSADHTNPGPNVRGFMTAFVLQLLFTGAAVVVSRVSTGSRRAGVLVLGLALLNAATVSWVMMGLRTERRSIVVFIVLVCVFAAGLLLWPAWDVYERARTF
jgi:hypothetical protein